MERKTWRTSKSLSFVPENFLIRACHLHFTRLNRKFWRNGKASLTLLACFLSIFIPSTSTLPQLVSHPYTAKSLIQPHKKSRTLSCVFHIPMLNYLVFFLPYQQIEDFLMVVKWSLSFQLPETLCQVGQCPFILFSPAVRNNFNEALFYGRAYLLQPFYC